MKPSEICILILAVAFFAFAIFFPSPAQSQSWCGYDQKGIRDGLEKKYGEIVINMGNSKRGILTLIFVSQKTHTWTIVSVNPVGMTCIIASGENWENVAAKAIGEPS